MSDRRRAWLGRVWNERAETFAKRWSFSMEASGCQRCGAFQKLAREGHIRLCPSRFRVVQQSRASRDSAPRPSGRCAESRSGKTFSLKNSRTCWTPAAPDSFARRTSSGAHRRCRGRVQRRSHAPHGPHEVGQAFEAKYSQCRGISTPSAATSALSVSRPSEGGQSMRTSVTGLEPIAAARGVVPPASAAKPSRFRRG